MTMSNVASCLSKPPTAIQKTGPKALAYEGVKCDTNIMLHDWYERYIDCHIKGIYADLQGNSEDIN